MVNKFNGGSELIVSNVAEANAVSKIFVNTNLAAAGGVMGALLVSKVLFGKSDLTMALNGAIAGLVSITDYIYYGLINNRCSWWFIIVF